GTRVAAADDHGRIAVWDVAANRQIWQLAASQGIWSTRFSPDGRQIATASEDGSVIVRDAEDGRALRTAALGAPVVTTTYGDDGTLYASTLDARVVRIAGDDNRSLPIHHSAAVWGLDVRAGRIATGSDDHVVDVTDLASGRLLFRREDEREVNAVALSPDARIVAFGGHAGRVQLAEVDSGRMLASLEGRADSVDAIEFSPDASYLITATVDGAITVWDRTGKALIVLDGPPTPFARISPLGDAVASGGADGRVRVWSIAPDLRDPSAVDALLACWVPYSLVDQRIVLRRASCVR
ncbi:MAG TPA: PQQ-binding-like beta-propeller repeat protein, partial [Kofleriaceae bacterium]|nr:PQQ-binding-like beta-propeller repeat protein [Kofleriaceae bacterium]